jgi:hypothetical protein
MRTPRGPSRTLKSLHRTVSTSDVPIVTRRHSRVGILVRSICCPQSREAPCGASRLELNLRVRGLLLRPAGESKTGISPRTPSFVLRTCKPKPDRPCTWKLLGNPRTRALFRLLSIRASRQAMLRTSSWLAPSIPNRSCDLPEKEDAQCVQPMSATQTNYVHPHLVRSRLALATFVAGTHVESKAPRDLPGDRTFHDVRKDRFGGSSINTSSEPLLRVSRPLLWSTSVGVFFPRR